jgi:hypothetical protein
MCDTKWGFNTNYGHRTLPFKWQSSNGFHFYEDKAVGSFSVCVWSYFPQHCNWEESDREGEFGVYKILRKA